VILLIHTAVPCLLTRYWEDTELMGKISAKLRDMRLAGGGQQQQQAAGKPSKVRHACGGR
jgi:hypothetical protein